jgi:ABC-type spermidine/putrescine transport system permease subunit I
LREGVPREAPMNRRSRLVVVPLVAPAAAVILFFFACLGVMVAYSVLPNAGMAQVGDHLTLANYRRFLGSPLYLSYVTRSLLIALYCTAITLVLGYAVAYAMYRASRRMLLLISLVLIVQFFTAYVIRTYAIMLVLGRNGIINRALLGLGIVDQPVKLLFSELGVAIGMVLVSIPFMAFPIYSSLHAIPRNLEPAAHALGASPLRCFWTVILPLTVPGISAGVIIVYLFQVTAYIIPALLGGGYYDMIANLIYSKAMSALDYPLAAAMAITMLAISCVLVYGAQKAFGRLAPAR